MDHIELFNKMIEYYEGDPKRIQHFTKVFEYCRLIGTMENIPEKEQFALETTYWNKKSRRSTWKRKL